MDRNSITGIALITLLFVTYMFYTQSQQDDNPKKPDAKTATAPKSQQGNTAAPTNPTQPQPKDSAEAAKALASRFGAFAPLAKGENRKITVRTDKLEMVLNTKGGNIGPVYLRDFKTYDSLPLPIISAHKDNAFTLRIPIRGQVVETRDLYFTPSQTADKIEVKGNDSLVLRLRGDIGQDKYIEQSYTFYGNKNGVKYGIKLQNLNEVVFNSNYELHQTIIIPQTEKSAEKMRLESSIWFKYLEDDVESLDIDEEETVRQTSELSLKWVAYKSQFFTAAIIAQDRFATADMRSIPTKNKNEIRKMEADLRIPYSRAATDSAMFTLYYGPNDIYLLDDYEPDLDQVVYLGWGPIRYVTLVIVAVFKFLEQFFSNYGLIIFLLAVFIKVLLTPLTWRSYLSTVKMQVVNKFPEMKALDEKYKDDPTELQRRKLTFYTQAGVNPLGGCIPLLLQMPILFAMFSFFPHSIELRQEAFLWADDLSTYDSILDLGFNIPFYGDHVSLFTLLMTASTLLYSYIQQRMQGTSNQPAQIKYLVYIMPIMFLGILNNYAAALSYYYLIYNILTMAQTYAMKFVVDEDKIHSQITTRKEKASKGQVKKGRIVSWLEQQQKKQQQIIRERQNTVSSPKGNNKPTPPHRGKRNK